MKTHRLKRVNEELLVKDQKRAKKAMALRTALNEARAGKQQLQAIFNAVSDALVGVDNQWQDKNVNRAAESIFVAGSYDLQGNSGGVFQRERDAQLIFLTPPRNSGEVKHPVSMRFGTEFDWESQPSTFLMFYVREDISLQDSQTVQYERIRTTHV